ncbi:unnamed protein product [Dracunculus medinensis]|uniref:Ovule protein n=1 Tax=Dracunculus medinensis TaxID=318479 RepID=A0A0N4UGZ9_DRAME|nr:unnamed protein product [Dracunculus medinensis]
MCLNVHLALNQHLRMPTTCYPLMIFQPSKLCRFYHARVASCGQSRQYTDRRWIQYMKIWLYLIRGLENSG